MIFATTNFINLEEVEPIEEIVKHQSNKLLRARVSLNENLGRRYELDETRSELKDDNFNFMGLSEPSKLNYLNVADNFVELPNVKHLLIVQFGLSRRVTR